MSIYAATQADDLNRCLASLAQQSLTPSQVVLAHDGPVESSVKHCIENYTQILTFRHIYFPNNRGLGHTLRDSLHTCKHELVARVDSDDWSIPKRFELQVDYLTKNPSISVVGGWLKEHYRDTSPEVSMVRRTPLDHKSLEHTARRRNPLNHPTVMFRKSHVLASGNYEPCLLFEDYFLWARMLMLGYHLTNLPHVLAETKADSEYFLRRGGIGYMRKELHLARKLREIGFFSPLDMTIFVMTRLPMRLLPITTRQRMYKAFLRNS